MSRHRRQSKPDRVLLGLKIATVVAAAGLVSLIIMVAAGGGTEVASPRPTSPDRPSTRPSDDAPAPTRPRLNPPELRTETTTIAIKPPPPSSAPKPRPTTRPPAPAPGPGFAFAVIGKPCPEPGTWSVTSDYRPVVCARRPPGGPLRWTPVF
jgi:hypothetical protein